MRNSGVSYQRRIIDDWLDEMFPHRAAIAIEGAKGVGKTATATRRARTVINLADPAQLSIVAGDWDQVTRVRPPVLIDEWQLEPSVWDRVKQATCVTSIGFAASWENVLWNGWC
jgi:hypothetical protein